MPRLGWICMLHPPDPEANSSEAEWNRVARRLCSESCRGAFLHRSIRLR